MRNGQEIVCIKKFVGVNTFGKQITGQMPQVNEIYTYDGSRYTGYYFIKEINYILNGSRIAFDPEKFAIVPPSLELEISESLNRQLQEACL